MNRSLGLSSLLLAALSALAASAAGPLLAGTGDVSNVPITSLASRLFSVVAVLLGLLGCYLLLVDLVVQRIGSKRRAHDAQSVLRLSFVVLAVVGVLGALTEQWLGVLVSLGVVGFAVTFALQQPLVSLLGWFYIMVKRPYGVGDRVQIEGSRGDVIEVGFLVTTLWEAGGDLVSSQQPSGRVVTVPNSVVLSAHVHNYSHEAFPYVWNDLPMQVAYETDLDFARDRMVEVADDYLGDEMARNVARYRDLLADTPVELDVNERPTVNVAQSESWVELRLRYLTRPRRAQQVRNELYCRIIAAFNEDPDRVSFPVSRNR